MNNVFLFHKNIAYVFTTKGLRLGRTPSFSFNFKWRKRIRFKHAMSASWKWITGQVIDLFYIIKNFYNLHLIIFPSTRVTDFNSSWTDIWHIFNHFFFCEIISSGLFVFSKDKTKMFCSFLFCFFYIQKNF